MMGAEPTTRLVPRSAFAELSAANAKEQLRDRRGLFSVLFAFGFMLLLITLINLAVNVQGKTDPHVAVTGDPASAARVAASLEASGFRPAAEADADVVVTAQPAGATVVVGTAQGSRPAWIGVQRAVEAAGYPPADVTVTEVSGFVLDDLLRANLAGVAMLGFLSAALMGTSVQLAQARARGLLRLLGTTPIRRATFLAAQVPVRFAIAALAAVSTIVIAVACGWADALAVLRLSVTLLLGLAMCFAFALLLGSRSRRPEAVNQAAVMIPILAVFATGRMVPREILPDWVWAAADALPTNWFAQAAGADLAGTATMLPVPLLWAMMAAVTVLVWLLAARLFVWDDRER